MPRQDVPYGGAICRLKERIAEIWDRLGEKLHSINGVEGDGAGNVEIVSGDAAITVSESPTGHYIEIGLDHGNLPSAAVSSVNGQTGAVRLDAKDILSYGDSNVQSDVDENKAAINTCSEAIASEQTARQNADAALQTNINTVSASIPEMSVTPDPYKGVERDAQGRASAADPASGATDKTLVTANWVSQTGDSGPNNLVHRSGNERINNVKDFQEIKSNNVFRSNLIQIGIDNKWRKVCQCSSDIARNHIFLVTSSSGAWPSFGILHTENDYGGFPRIYWVIRKYNSSQNSDLRLADCVALTANNGDNHYNIFVKGSSYMRFMVMATFIQNTTIDDVIMADTIEDYDSLEENYDKVYYSQDYP